MFPKFTKRQWLTLIVFSISDFCNAICVSLQAPFYPKEFGFIVMLMPLYLSLPAKLPQVILGLSAFFKLSAEKKGATATEYGLVFGVFELVVFIVSPIYGKHLNRIGPKLMFNGGIFTVGVCAIVFGILDRIDGRYPFITLSFVVRIVEAMGNAAFLTASFAIIAKEFPDNVATTFASLETFFGLGLIVGPTVGGALYQVGGYTTPFAVLGSALFLSAIMTAFILPDHGESEVDSKGGGSLIQVLKIPGVLLAACSIIVTSISIGFLQATLEPHLRHFNFQPVILGLMFVINGGTYALTAPCWGWLCDKKVYPKIVTVIGCVLIIFGFTLIGPAPFLSTPATVELSVVGLVGHGFGIAAQLVASFTDALRTSISNGFPNNLETYGLISGLWTSTFALGAFIGPSMAGILYDIIGFENATMVVVALNAIVGVIVIMFITCLKNRKPYKQIPLESDVKVSENGSSIGTAPSHGTSNGVLIERPPGMNGLIACNSYKNRHGTWHRRETGAVLIGPYSTSYGSLESRGFLESVA